MGITLHWFLPTSGDSRNVVPGSGGHGRPASIDYLAQIARAADELGFDAVLTPTGTWCEDAWLVTAALSQHTTGCASWSPSGPASPIPLWPPSRRRPSSGSPAAAC